jgi:hypothetical protein
MITSLIWGFGVILLVEGAAYSCTFADREGFENFSRYLNSTKTNDWCINGFSGIFVIIPH